MFAHDERIAQRDHEQNTQDAAAQGDDRDLQKARLLALALSRPQEQRGKGEDCARSQRLACGTDRLDDVALQNGVAAHQDADNAHGDNRRRNGGRHGEADAQAQLRVCRTENNCQEHTDDH